jgi:hypothetical protein
VPRGDPLGASRLAQLQAHSGQCLNGWRTDLAHDLALDCPQQIAVLHLQNTSSAEKREKQTSPKQTRGSSGLLHPLAQPLWRLVPATARRGRGGPRPCDGPRAARRAAAWVFTGEESSCPPVPRPRARGGGSVLRCSTTVGEIWWRRVEAGDELCHRVRSRKPPPLLSAMVHPPWPSHYQVGPQQRFLGQKLSEVRGLPWATTRAAAWATLLTGPPLDGCMSFSFSATLLKLSLIQ